MRNKRLVLDDFKKKMAANHKKLSYAKGGMQIDNESCINWPLKSEDDCHPKPN